MIHQSLVTFPAVFRKFAAELKPKGMTESDLLALLIARHYLTQNQVQYVSQAFELSDAGGMQLKPAIREKSTEKGIPDAMLRVVGVEGPAGKAVWHVPPIGAGYNHVWLWWIAPPGKTGATVEHYAQHWRAPVQELETWEVDGLYRVLSVQSMVDQTA